jgi:hypothetical protein
MGIVNSHSKCGTEKTLVKEDQTALGSYVDTNLGKKVYFIPK